jgi:hypothetical protein
MRHSHSRPGAPWTWSSLIRRRPNRFRAPVGGSRTFCALKIATRRPLPCWPRRHRLRSASTKAACRSGPGQSLVASLQRRRLLGPGWELLPGHRLVRQLAGLMRPARSSPPARCELRPATPCPAGALVCGVGDRKRTLNGCRTRLPVCFILNVPFPLLSRFLV